MSCQVMYQSQYPYFPYQRNTDDPIKEVQPGGDLSVPGARGSSPCLSYSFSSPSQYGAPAPAPAPAPSSASFPAATSLPPLTRGVQLQAGVKAVKGEKDKDGEVPYMWGEKAGEDGQRTANYMSDGSLYITYYTGDLTKALEDHFAASLSSPSPPGSVSLRERSLPPSFWDSSWQPREETPYHPEHYSGDPWQQYMAAQMAVGGGYSAHQMYSSARSYSSLLLQSHRHREWVEQSYGTNVWEHSPTPAHTANSHAWF